MSEPAGEEGAAIDAVQAEEHKPSADAPSAPEVPTETPPVAEPVPEAPAPEPAVDPSDPEPAVDPPTPEPAIDPPAPEPSPPAAPPSVTRVEPDRGPLCGGTTLMVRGEAFAEGCQVLLDGAAVATAREGDTCLRVETPARATKGLVELRVVNPDGQIAVYEDDFRYDPPPAITGIEPAWVSIEGGAVVTVLGADFARGCAVSVGGVLVPSSWIHAGRLEAVTKARDAGEADVEVKNPDGQAAARAGAVRSASPRAIGDLAPGSANTAGGAEFGVDGCGFERGCAVLVAGVPVAAVTYVSDTEIRFQAPKHGVPEAVEVAVVNPTGLAHRRPFALTYVKAPPRVASIAPDRGPNVGGTEIVLRGEDLDEGAAVYVCGIVAKVAFRSREELAVITPPVARDGVVDVRVVNLDDQAHTLEKAFRYLAPLPPPVLREVSPKRGSQAGGLAVALLGEDFADGVKVRFGGVPAAVRFLTGKELAVTTPAFSGYGEIAVEVVNPDGATSSLPEAFAYEARPAPEITGIAPTSGPTTGARGW